MINYYNYVKIVTASRLAKESVHLATVYTVSLFKIEIKKNWSNLEYYSPVGLNMLLNNLSFPSESIVNIIDIFTKKKINVFFHIKFNYLLIFKEFILL